MGNQAGSTAQGDGDNDPLTNLRQSLIHTKDSHYVREKIKQLLNIGKLNDTTLRSEASINVLKYLARVHGLPPALTGVLVNLLVQENKEGESLSASHKYKIFLVIKYAVGHDTSFIPLTTLLALLDQFPSDRLDKKDFFTTQSITQLMLAITSILNPDRITSEGIDESKLWKLESYLVFITGNRKGEVKRVLEKMGFWSGSAAQHTIRTKGGEGRGLLRNGEEIITSVQKRKGINVSAHVVRTQQTEAITTEENVSEKTQMSNISLSNALNQGRTRTMAAATAKETLEAPRSASGSDRCWYKTSGVEIYNFLVKARGKGVISQDDVTYLTDKLSGYKFSITASNRDMIVQIAETFYHISKYQQLSEGTIMALLNKLLSDDHNGGRYTEARVHVLQATDRYSTRLGKVPEPVQKKLASFRDASSGCTERMRRLIWNILSTDDTSIGDNLREAIRKLEVLEDCEPGLNYIQRQISIKGRGTELKKFPELIPKLLQVAQGKFKEAEGSEEVEEEFDPFVKLGWSELNWLETIAYPSVVTAAGILKVAQSVHAIKVKKGKAEDTEQDTPDPEAMSGKSLEVLEDFLQLDWSPGLEPEQIDFLTCVGLATCATNGDTKGKIVRCILRSFEKGLKNPDWNYFSKFSVEQLEGYIHFLFTFTSSGGIDKRLQICTLILLANMMDMASLKGLANLALSYLPLLRSQLQRNDIVLTATGKVVMEEEELNKDLFKYDQPPEDFQLVSAFIAKILLRLVEVAPKSCDELTMSAVSQVALSSSRHAKMTKIICAELLFTAAKFNLKFSPSVLDSIQSLCFSPIVDVHVYITAAYCSALSNPFHSLESEQVNFLVNLYSMKKVCLDKEDFSEWINPKILTTFKRSTEAKLRLSEQVFHLLALVLNSTCADSEDSPDYPTVKMILDIVTIYCKDEALLLPSTLVEAVENLLLESDVFDESCAGIVEQCMLAGRWVSDSVIEEFAKYLWHEPETSIPFLRRLAIANENQELPNSMFEAFQMELIGLRLHPNASTSGRELLRQIQLEGGDPQELFGCLSDFITRGKLVSPLNLEVFRYLLDIWRKGSERKIVIQNLTWVVANGQSLPKSVIDSALVQDGDYFIQLEFALGVVQRGHQLPSQFLSKVCKEMEVTDGKRVLNLIKTMIQHNHPMSSKSLTAYCQRLLQLSTSKEGLPPQLLSSLIHCLENKVDDMEHLSLIKDVLLKSVESKNATLVQISRKGLKLLPREMLGEDKEQELGLKGLSVGAATLIAKFLARRRRPLSRQLLSAIQDSLERPSKWSSRKLDELEGLLASDPELLEKVAKLLREREGTLNDFEVTLVESICLTLADCKSPEVEMSCKDMLEAIVRDRGFTLTPLCLDYLNSSEKIAEWLLTMEAHDELFTTMERWKLKPSSQKKRAAFGEYLKDFQFCSKHHSRITAYLAPANYENWKTIPYISNPVAASILGSSAYANIPPEFIAVLEQDILHGDGLIQIHVLQAFNNIQRYSKQLTPCLLALLDYFREKEASLKSSEIIQLFRIFRDAAANQQELPPALLDFFLETIPSKNPLVRGKSLEVLLIIREKKGSLWTRLEEQYWPKLFEDSLITLYSEVYGEDSEEEWDLEENEVNLTLLRVVHSLTYWEVGGLRKKKKDEWASHLLISDAILRFSSTVDEQFELFPVVSEFCKLVPLEEHFDVMEGMKTYLQDSKNRMSPAKIITLVKLALSNKFNTRTNMMPGSAPWIEFLIFQQLGKLLCDKVPGLSVPIAVLTIEDLVTTIPVDILELIISRIEEGSGFRQFQQLLSFVSSTKKEMSLIRSYMEGVEGTVLLQILQSSLQATVLISLLPKLNSSLLSLVEGLTGKLLLRNFDYILLLNLFTSTGQSVKKMKATGEFAVGVLENVLYQMEAYSVHFDMFSQIVSKLEQKKIQEWVECSNALVMEHVYGGSAGMKSAKSMAREFSEVNTSESYQEDPDKFSEMVRVVQDGRLKSSFSSISNEIVGNWTPDEISRWATAAKENGLIELTETLAVISRACYLLRNYRLTPIQILSIRSATCSGLGKGRLLQVATGSGKSTIIVAIAVIKALAGLSVDVYTSSPVLGERDAKTWASFYKLFGLSVDHNGDKGSGYIRGEKNCYRKNIVYGDTSQFQFDALRHEYSGLGTRGGRSYKTSFAIVDEVDSMLVDDSSKLARLSSTLPGMDLLQILYHFIWQRLTDVQHRLFALQDGTFYLEGARSVDANGNMLYTYQLPDGSSRCIQNIGLYILNNKNEPEELNKAFIYKVKNVDEFVVDHLKDYTKALIGIYEFKDRGIPVPKLALPKPLVKFATNQVGNWIDSAITAIAFQENVHYVVDQDTIKPVDFHTTGIIQSSTNWNNGLHQFLQIKHSLKVSTETVTTNFLSNMAMFQKYGNDLIGFSGTLGSDFGQNILKEVYSVETVIIPELYYKLFHQLPDSVLPNEKEWLGSVVHSALHESAKSRAVLVICHTIKEAEKVAAQLTKEGNDSISVKLYTRNDANQEKQVEQVNPGDIIVATNLAGRGTDIKTTKVEKFGGLHIILTFLPDSLRVEEQAFGRTSRQGNKGSGELILASRDSGDVLKRRRDLHEKYLLTNFKDNELARIEMKDKLFGRFSKMYSRIRMELLQQRYANKLKGVFGLESLSVSENTLLQAIEEQWATFLKKIDDGTISSQDADEQYQLFETEIEQDYQSNNSISSTKNAFYWIQCGNDRFKQKELEEAMSYFDKAISTDSDFCAGAHAGKGFALLQQKSPKETYKVKALEHMNDAIKIIYTEISLYSTAQTLLQHRGGRVDSELFKQLTEKINLLGEFCRNIEGNISAVSTSLRRVYATECFEGVEYTKRLDDLKPEVQNRYGKHSKFHLEFHDLSFFSDNGLQCQAIDSIKNCKNHCKHISIQLHNQNLQELTKQMEGETNKLPLLQLDGLNSWAGVRKIVSAFEPKSFTLVIEGDKEFATKLAKLPILEGKSFLVRYEMDDVMYCKTLKRDFDQKEIPDNAKLRVEVELQKIQELGDIKSLNLEPTISIILKDVSKEAIETNWNPLLQGFNSNAVTISGMSSSKVEAIIRLLRDKNIGFLLKLEGMSQDNAKKCLSLAVRKQEEIEQSSMKEMQQQFSADYLPLESLRELCQRGILLMPVFGEKAFIPWRSVISVAIVASVQVAAGAALVCTGFGATVGLGLITEGMSDYVTAYRAYSTRHFSWQEYAIQKAVSLTISVVSMGLGALKDGAKGAAQLGQAAATEVVEQAGTQVITGVGQKTLNQTIKETGKKLGSLVTKQIAVQGVETAARTTINSIVESVAQFAFESVKDNISLEVDNTMRREFRKPEVSSMLATYTAMDLARRNKLLHAKVNGWLTEVTNPQSGNWNKAFDQVAYPLCNGIFSDPRYLGSKFSMTLRLITLINGSYQILTVTQKVAENIEGKLRNEVKSFTPAYALQEKFSLSSADAERVTALLKFGKNGTFHVEKFPTEADLETCKIEGLQLDQLKGFLNSLHATETKFTMENNYDMSKLIMSVVEHLTAHLIQVANRQLVSPLTTLAVGKLVATISQEIQSKYLVSDSDMSKDQQRVKELKEKDPSQLTNEDKEFLMNNDRPMTFVEQIRGNAKDLTVAYQVRNIVAAISTISEEDRKRKEIPENFTDESFEAITNIFGGGPADVTVVFILAKLNDADIKLVDDPAYEPTEKDKESGVKIVCWKKPEDGQQVGHYVLKDAKTGVVTNFKGGGINDCAYNVLASITGKSASDLRLQAATFVACNQEKFGEINEASNWIKERYPQEAISLLFVGGRERRRNCDFIAITKKRKVISKRRGENEEGDDDEVLEGEGGDENEVLDGDEEVNNEVLEGEEDVNNEVLEGEEDVNNEVLEGEQEENIEVLEGTEGVLAERVITIQIGPGTGSRPDPNSQVCRNAKSLTSAVQNANDGDTFRIRSLDGTIETLTAAQFEEKYGRHFVGGHIGNARLATRGTDKNMLTITKSLNGKMSAGFEQPINNILNQVRAANPQMTNTDILTMEFVTGNVNVIYLPESTGENPVPVPDTVTCRVYLNDPNSQDIYESILAPLAERGSLRRFEAPEGSIGYGYEVTFTNTGHSQRVDANPVVHRHTIDEESTQSEDRN